MSESRAALDAALAAHGLLRLAEVALAAGEIAPPPGRAPARSATIVGNAGPAMWRAFEARARSPAGEGPHPLDAWTRAAIEPIAARLGAFAVYPFDGPPWLPVQALALRSGAFHRSPLGLTIHAEYGLWHGFRAVLCFADPPPAPAAAAAGQSPCAACRDRPCLSACPVGAFDGAGYDVAACRTHLDAGEPDCMTDGCRARRACPVGTAWRQAPAQAAFHMRAFRDSSRQPGARPISSLRRAT